MASDRIANVVYLAALALFPIYKSDTVFLFSVEPWFAVPNVSALLKHKKI